jgi:hypothetical protein
LIACLTWLSNVVQFVKCVGGSPPAAAGELNQRPRDSRRHPLILDGFRPPSPSALTRVGTPADKCLHVLSSFQRTDPATRTRPTGFLGTPPPTILSSGEPFNITNSPLPCQPFSASVRCFLFLLPAPVRRRGKRHRSRWRSPAQAFGSCELKLGLRRSTTAGRSGSVFQYRRQVSEVSTSTAPSASQLECLGGWRGASAKTRVLETLDHFGRSAGSYSRTVT